MAHTVAASTKIRLMRMASKTVVMFINSLLDHLWCGDVA